MKNEKRVFVPRKKRENIGTYRPRTEAWKKARGTGNYSQDLALKRKYQDMVYMRILKSPYPHAIIKSMDTTAAEKLPGVVGILRYDDPEVAAMEPFTACWTDATNSASNIQAWGCKDRRVLSDRGRWVGDEVGVAVAAETAEIAEEALRLIEIEWEELPFCLTIDDAMREDAPIIHPDINPESNFLPNTEMWGPDIFMDEGDVDKGFAEADEIVEAKAMYKNPQECALDYWNCMMYWTDDQLISISDSYAVDQSRIFLSDMLGIPLNKIRCISPLEGGQHGRGNTGEQPFFLASALMSKKIGRQVRYFQTRQEHFHDTRTECYLTVKIGAKKDGTITAIDFDMLGNAGAYSDCTIGEIKYVPPEWLESMLAGIPNLRFTGRAVYTNIVPASCMRSIGNIEMNYIFGLGTNMLAEKLGIDEIDILKKNVSGVGCTAPDPSVVGILDEGAKLIGWDNRHAPGEGEWIDGCKKRGIGFSLNNTWHTENQEFRRGPTQVMIKLNHDGSVIIDAPTVEVGGGSSTCAVLAAADGLGVPYENFHWIYQQDTETGLKDVVQSDSSVSLVLAEAARECAVKVKEEFLAKVARKWDRKPEELDMKDGRVFVKTQPEISQTIREYYDSVDLWEEENLVPVTVMHSWPIDDKSYGFAYMATFAEVEVDTETGEVDVLRMVVCSDGGTVLFPAGAEGQLTGGQCQGLGEALYEEMIYDEATGIPLNFNFVDYKFPTMADYPDIDPVPMEIFEGHGEYGACGMGEAAPCCTPRAISNAIYNAIGVRINETAASPVKILNALGKEGR